MLGGQVAATTGGAEAVLPAAKAGKLNLLPVGADVSMPRARRCKPAPVRRRK
jgi:hypothetical protein